MGMLKIPNSIFALNSAIGGNTSNTFGGTTATYSALSSSSYSLAQTLSASSICGLHLYKGSIPTQAQLDAMSGTVYTTSASLPRTADLLVILPTIGTPAFTLNNYIINLQPAIASAAGTPGWFMLFASLSNNSGSHCLAGTVGAVNSGADIELLTMSIVAGALYKLPQISIPFVSKFSW